MIEHIVRAVQDVGAEDIRVVVGFGEKLVRQLVEPYGVSCHKQINQAGTADAVRAAEIDMMEGMVLILNGDHPLIRRKDIEWVLKQVHDLKSQIAVVTCELEDPGNFGRVVRYHGSVQAIVEARDATHESRKIKEIHTGIYFIDSALLQDFLPQIQSRNVQGEYYLTDIVGLAVESGIRVDAIPAPQHFAFGVNTQGELAMASEKVFQQKVEQLLESGVIIMDPKTCYVEDTVEVASGATLFPNVFLRGDTKIGAMSVIEPNCFIVDCQIGEGVHIKAGCYMEKAVVSARAEVGPYAHLRPDSEIGEECKIGNFVETKKVKMAKKSQAKHLTYLGDAEIGENTNIGCGTITCNYAVDRKKYKTKIGKNVFVGSDSQFVAPVTIGDGAVIGSGSTITKDVPARALAVARSKQIVKENYVNGDGPVAETSETRKD
jgi:bifunctional UDP-N-acetylglucosamine pyrophosphorylase/glucosamine-1-phosphate N-acetyltransferase